MRARLCVCGCVCVCVCVHEHMYVYACICACIPSCVYVTSCMQMLVSVSNSKGAFMKAASPFFTSVMIQPFCRWSYTYVYNNINIMMI